MMAPLWRKAAAFIAARPTLVDWIVRRAQRTPYYPIKSQDGQDVYMGRWWLFNPYGKDDQGEIVPARWSWLPSIRIHHIMRPDNDRHHHDHPWNARTIVLRGWYLEERQEEGQLELYARMPGYTGRLMFGQYHRIADVSPGGVWTLFITGRKRGTWGFDVGGRKVPWSEYLAAAERAESQAKEVTHG